MLLTTFVGDENGLPTLAYVNSIVRPFVESTNPAILQGFIERCQVAALHRQRARRPPQRRRDFNNLRISPMQPPERSAAIEIQRYQRFLSGPAAADHLHLALGGKSSRILFTLAPKDGANVIVAERTKNVCV